MTSPAIEMVAVRRQFPGRVGLDELTLDVPRGGVFGVLGPNGAGKTTTLRVLLGLLSIEAGSVRVLGLDPVAEGTRVRESVGVLLEHDGLYDRLTALDNLQFHARIRHLGAAAAPRIEELLRSFDLWERRGDAVATWSKGMRQKLAIARAMLHRPALLLLDEPFSGLDPAAAVELRGRIGAMGREEDVTILLTTHDLAHVERSCSEVAVIQRGKVIARGSPDALGKSNEPAVDVVGQGLSEEVLAAMQREGLVIDYRWNGKTARVRCVTEARPRLGVELVGRGVALEELTTVKSSLEEAFLSIVGSAGA
jgi:ABC-2 type transport system ATP-binding protein